jgi:outer membrane protein assembly complex protein YaeT
MLLRHPGPVLLLVLSLTTAFAGPAGEVIVRVDVLLDGEQAPPEIRGLVPVRPGEILSPRLIDRSLVQLYSTGLFSDVRVERRDGREAILVYILSKKLYVRNLVLPRGMRLPARTLRTGLTSLRPGAAFHEDRLARASAEMEELLRREGYFRSRVRASAGKDSSAGTVDILFDIDPGRRYVVASVDIRSDIELQERKFKRMMASRQGELFAPSLLEKDLELVAAALREAGYQRARVEAEEPRFDEEKGAVNLALNVEAGERVEIVVAGARVPVELIRPIWEERVFEEWGLQEGEARVLSALRKKGFIFALVSSRIEREENLIRVVHEVDPGERCLIRGVSFRGLAHFTAEELDAALELAPGFPGLSVLDGERVFSLPGDIIDLYRTRGFPRARVELEFERDGRSVTVIYLVDEGPRETLDGVRIEGASLFDASRLLEEVGSRPGGPYFQPSIQTDAERLESFYLDQGVRGTRITPEVLAGPGGGYDLTFRVQEGRRMVVEKITVTGQKATRRATILRELRLREGEPPFRQALLESRRNLERLGIFTEVKIEEVPVSSGAQNVIISLREGGRNYVSFGLGLENKNIPFSLAVWDNVISPRGTAEYIRHNVFGDASQFSLVGQFSLREKRGVVSFEKPYFFGLPVQNILSGWLEREDRSSYGFDRRGASLSGVFSLYRDILLLATLTWSSTTLYYLDIAENEVDRQFFPFSKTSISGTALRDRRDDSVNPVRGSFLSASLEWATPLFGVESDFLKLFAKYQSHHTLFSALRVGATVRLGLGQGRMPIHERFFAGGSNSFRGTDFDELGPLDPRSGRPVGGKVLLLFNLETSFPVIGSLRDLSWAFFVDAGNVFAKRKDFDLAKLRGAVGFGLRYRTPLGPIRLDLGLNPQAPPGRKKIFPFITIGHVF